jgi:hypothetical protein
MVATGVGDSTTRDSAFINVGSAGILGNSSQIFKSYYFPYLN